MGGPVARVVPTQELLDHNGGATDVPPDYSLRGPDPVVNEGRTGESPTDAALVEGPPLNEEVYPAVETEEVPASGAAGVVHEAVVYPSEDPQTVDASSRLECGIDAVAGPAVAAVEESDPSFAEVDLVAPDRDDVDVEVPGDGRGAGRNGDRAEAGGSGCLEGGTGDVEAEGGPVAPDVDDAPGGPGPAH